MKTAKGIEIVSLRTPLHDRIAEQLSRDIRNYRIPAGVRKRTGICALSDAGADWLIVLCSPGSQEDPDTLEAIARFTEAGLYHRILTVLVEGNPSESFPESLLFEKKPDGTVVSHEPLAANIVANDDRQRLRKLETEKLRLFAPILGVSFDSLMNRRRRRLRRIALTAAAVVLAAAGAFLGYALNRMQIMADQNATLSAVYAETEAARDKARTDRDEAREFMARRVAVQAESVLKSGDSELALLLCLEYLPEMRQIAELTDVLEDALNTLCADGYVPVTTRKAYLQSGRPITKGLRSIPAGMPENVAIRVPYPDGKSGSDELAYLELADTYTPDNLAVYKTGTHYGWKGAWICEADSAESGRFLTKPDGSLYAADAVRFAGDGSLLLAEAERLYRLDPETGKELPVQEGEPEYSLTLDFPVEYIWHGEAVPGKAHDVGRFWITDSFKDRLFALGRNGFSVFSADPVKLLYTVCDEHTAEAELSPFYSSYWTGFCPVATPAGERYVIVGSKYVYDAETGALLFEIEDYGQNLGGRIMQSTAEGYVPIQVYDVLYIWDLTMRQPVGFIPGAYYRYTVCGPYDEVTNRCSASVIVTDSDELYDLSTSTVDGMIWVLKDMAVPVPKDLEGKIALARELLDGRKLTEAERLKYKLSGK